VVKRCEELGVLVDVTHCSDRSLATCSRRDEARGRTHTGFRRFLQTERNLSTSTAAGRADRRHGRRNHLERLLGGDSIENMADSIVHGALVAGADHIGIGTTSTAGSLPPPASATPAATPT